LSISAHRQHIVCSNLRKTNRRRLVEFLRDAFWMGSVLPNWPTMG
jgi:hypothetical protein